MSAAILALPRTHFALACARATARRIDASALELATAADILRDFGDYPADHMLRHATLARIRLLAAQRAEADRIAADVAPRPAHHHSPMPAMVAASPAGRRFGPAGALDARCRRVPLRAPARPSPAPARAGAFPALRALVPWLLLSGREALMHEPEDGGLIVLLAGIVVGGLGWVPLTLAIAWWLG